MNNPKILDPCCGSRMFYFDKQDPRVLFGDIRAEQHLLKDRHYLRKLEVSPDVLLDFTNLPFDDDTFYLVVFDPPHLIRGGDSSWLVKKYGRLPEDWQDYLRQGFKECFRVLRPNGVLIFKWNENQVKNDDVLALTEYRALFGHKTRKETTWFTFMKD